MKKLKLLLFILGITFTIIIDVFATDINNVKMCNITNEYKDWLSLDDDQKSSVIMPVICQKENKTKEYALPKPGITVPNFLFTGDTDYTVYNYYNSVDEGYVTPVRDQGETGLCWSFASNAMLESYFLSFYDEEYNFSERHMDKVNTTDVFSPEGSYGRLTDGGGNEFMAANYYFNGYGPVDEADVQFDDYSSYTKEQLLSYERKVNVKGMIFYSDSNDLACSEEAKYEIKNAIGSTGGVFASLYIGSDTYNFDTGATHYDGTSSYSTNHSIELVGWDNNYSLSNFKTGKQPEVDGAWIAKNSWGEDFGDGGYIYISYEDVNICKSIAYIEDADTDINDKIYYNDYAGFGGAYLTSDTTDMRIAEKFTRVNSEREKVKNITFLINNETHYNVYINPNNDSLADEDLIYVGYVGYNFFGYNTLDVSDQNIYLTGTKYAIVIKETNDLNSYSVPIQIKFGDMYEAEGKADTSFIYNPDTQLWDDLTTLEDIGAEYMPSLNVKVTTNNIIRSYNNLEFKDSNIYMMPTTLNDFKNKLILDNSVVLDYSEPTIETNPLLKTGYNINLDETYTYNLIVIGDATSDGQIKINDVAKLNDYLLGNNNMNSYQLLAIDLARDNQIKINDIAKLNDYMLGNISVLSNTLTSGQ